MISIEHATVIIGYLSAKLEVEERWYVTPNEAFFGKAPVEIVLEGHGDLIIEFLEIRLGLREGAAF